jgi:hypothetical protein
MAFDPFSRHRGKPEPKGQAEPDQAQPAVEAAAVNLTEAPASEPCPPTVASRAGNATTKPVAARTGNPFSRHGGEPKARPEPARAQKSSPPARELLVWIQQCWNKPIISLRDIQVYGPSAIRDRATAISHVEALAAAGWLAETKAHRRDRRIWRLPPRTVAEL